MEDETEVPVAMNGMDRVMRIWVAQVFQKVLSNVRHPAQSVRRTFKKENESLSCLKRKRV